MIIAQNETVENISSINGVVEFCITKRTLKSTTPAVKWTPRVTYKIQMCIYGVDTGYFEGPDINSMYDWATEQLKIPLSYHILKYA